MLTLKDKEGNIIFDRNAKESTRNIALMNQTVKTSSVPSNRLQVQSEKETFIIKRNLSPMLAGLDNSSSQQRKGYKKSINKPNRVGIKRGFMSQTDSNKVFAKTKNHGHSNYIHDHSMLLPMN